MLQDNASAIEWRRMVILPGWHVRLSGNRTGLLKVELSPPAYSKNRGRQPDWAEDAGRQILEYLSGSRKQFDIPLAGYPATPFEEKVWSACRKIPYGQLITYGRLAEMIDAPKAARAVGGALGRNPLPLITPCHRVIGASGRLTGFSCGLEWKKKLLQLENSAPPSTGFIRYGKTKGVR